MAIQIERYLGNSFIHQVDIDRYDINACRINSYTVGEKLLDATC